MNLTPDQFVDPVPGLLVCRLAWFTLHDDFVTLEVASVVLNGSLLQLVPLSDFMCIDLLIARLLIKQVICSASALREVWFPGAASCQLLCFEWQRKKRIQVALTSGKWELSMQCAVTVSQ